MLGNNDAASFDVVISLTVTDGSEPKFLIKPTFLSEALLKPSSVHWISSPNLFLFEEFIFYILDNAL
jgi:hypothetical protein